MTLTVQITLPKDVHVYSPGAQGYKSIGLQLDSIPEVKIGPARYPTSQTLYLAAIKEKMPVFSGTFRITQDVTLSASSEFIRNLRAVGSGGRAIELRGTLSYQACNDTICFLPEKVPLAWQFTAIRLDVKRASEGIRHSGNP